MFRLIVLIFEVLVWGVDLFFLILVCGGLFFWILSLFLVGFYVGDNANFWLEMFFFGKDLYLFCLGILVS